MKRPYATPSVVSRPRERCLVDGCPNFEELTWSGSSGGLCSGHRKRKQRGQRIDVPLDQSRAGRVSARELVLQAALAFADAEPEQVAAKTYTLLRLAKVYGRGKRR